ncbi:MAG: hypothetical protein JNM17_07970 [Archangium sp.]|nr:hypothetical protein [Archangium sp.]
MSRIVASEAKSPRLVSKKPAVITAPTITPRRPEPKKFVDGMSTGRGAALRQLVEKRIADPRAIHNAYVASHLKETTTKLFDGVFFRCPLPPSASPRPGPDGRWVAPNGDPLIRVNVSADGRRIPGSGTYMLVNPKTNEVYREQDSGGFINHRTFTGPLKLPVGQRFQGKTFSEAQLRQFERLANRDAPIIRRPPLGEVLERHLKLGDLEFGQKAPRPEDIAKQVVVKSEHPFTYYAITLKDDPNHVIFKKVLTGGFVPAGPNDGTYSQPVAI